MAYETSRSGTAGPWHSNRISYVDAHLASYLRWSGFKFHFEATMPASRFSSLIRAIATDVHFWIPLSVLLGGLVLLDKLR